MVSQKYRWDFIGLSTDEKPTSETSDKVVNGSTYYCSDTSKLYVYCNGTWYERKALGEGGGGGGSSYTAGEGIDITNDVISATNTGKAKVLTTEDYNWPTDNPTRVALWMLEPGIYRKASSSVQVAHNTSSFTSTYDAEYIIGRSDDGVYATIIAIKTLTNNETNYPIQYYKTIISSGSNATSGNYSPVTFANVIDNLTSSYTSQPLSANQGKVLKDFIGDLTNLTTTDKTNLVAAINEAAAGLYDGQSAHDAATVAQGNTLSTSAPTTSTVGVLGQLYTDTTNMHTYQCTAISGDTYTWSQRW